MKKYTDAQRIEMVKIHYQNGENFKRMVRFFGLHNAASHHIAVQIIEKFKAIGSDQMQNWVIHVRTKRSNENIAAVSVLEQWPVSFHLN